MQWRECLGRIGDEQVLDHHVLLREPHRHLVVEEHRIYHRSSEIGFSRRGVDSRTALSGYGMQPYRSGLVFCPLSIFCNCRTGSQWTGGDCARLDQGAPRSNHRPRHRAYTTDCISGSPSPIAASYANWIPHDGHISSEREPSDQAGNPRSYPQSGQSVCSPTASIVHCPLAHRSSFDRSEMSVVLDRVQSTSRWCRPAHATREAFASGNSIQAKFTNPSSRRNSHTPGVTSTIL